MISLAQLTSCSGDKFYHYVQYVECDREGLGYSKGACSIAKIRGYPTWVIGGKVVEGEMEVAELEQVVGEIERGEYIGDE